MGIISPITEFSLSVEHDFPAPSEKEKLNKLIDNDSKLIKSFPFRSDIGEIKFRLADALVGRNNTGDYERANSIFDEILLNYGSPYLRARAQVGKAELFLPGAEPEKIKAALALCEKARKNLKADLSDFFMAKTFIVEAELRLARNNKKDEDHKKALSLHEKIIKAKAAHWYFRARAMLGKAEIILYNSPKKIADAIILCKKAEQLLKSRPGDYFLIKTKLIESELLCEREKGSDIKKAEALLTQIIKSPNVYNDLLARARLILSEISRNSKASLLISQLNQMEGLDPYVMQKVKMVEEELKLEKGKHIKWEKQ